MFAYFQYMAVGRAGLPGAHAQKLVVMAGSTVSDTVTTLCLNMEEGDATETASGHVLATSNIVQVKAMFISIKS